MKFLTFALLITLSACGTTNYTSNKYFKIDKAQSYNPLTDKEKLIYAILERAVVTNKDVPDYWLLKDKKKIYISNTYCSNFFAKKADFQEFTFENKEVPNVISDVRFCLKTKEELQKIADESIDFIHLSLGSIDIKENSATIGISTNWISSNKTAKKRFYQSGGGYILIFEKVNGEWKYVKTLESWIS
jgi:hypothetical protein